MLNLAGCKAKKNHEGISWFTWWNWGSPDGTDGSSLIRHETRICGGKILLARGQWPPSTWIFVMKYILIYPKTNAWNTWNGDLEDVLSNFWKKRVIFLKVPCWTSGESSFGGSLEGGAPPCSCQLLSPWSIPMTVCNKVVNHGITIFGFWDEEHRCLTH